VAMAIAPLIFAPIYDGIGNKRGQEMLAVTACISFLATVAYIPLIGWLPKPQKAIEAKMEEISVYDQMSDLEFSMLPMEISDAVNMKKMMELKTAPRLLSWGSYAEERTLLSGIDVRAVKDFAYYSREMIKLLCNKDLLIQEQKNYKVAQEMMPKVDRDRAKAEMGSWIADYFDDAGYEGWDSQTTIFKAMLMNAFPPIDALDMKKPDYSNMPLDKWEEHLTKFLRIMDGHIAQSQRRGVTSLSTGSVLGVFRRR